MSKSSSRIIFRLEHSSAAMVCCHIPANRRSSAGMALPRSDGHRICQAAWMPASAKLYYMMQSYTEFNAHCVQTNQEHQNQAQTEHIPAAACFYSTFPFHTAHLNAISSSSCDQQLTPVKRRLQETLTLPSPRLFYQDQKKRLDTQEDIFCLQGRNTQQSGGWHLPDLGMTSFYKAKKDEQPNKSSVWGVNTLNLSCLLKDIKTT